MCSSLAQLCFVDANLAKNIWISIIPGIWSLFNDNQRKLLSSKAVKFLENSKLKNNFKAAFYEAIIQCEPKINFEPYDLFLIEFNIYVVYYKYLIYAINYFSYQLVYIGKTYNLWYKVIEQMEDISNYFQHDKKNVSCTNLYHLFLILF